MSKQTSPRLLRVLRIDDDLPTGIPTRPSPRFREELPPAFLEPVCLESDGSKMIGIKNWAMAIRYWLTLEQAPEADLIISDVQFADSTSPLSRLRPSLKTPAGLGHFKSFAAIARVRGTPIGIAIHTADSRYWEMSVEDPDPAVRAMALLAAHEIGELAAILGDAPELPEGGADACWRWLNRFTERSGRFREAIPLALTDYRKRLGEMRVLPEDWDRLNGWCASMIRRCEEREKLAQPALAFLDEDSDDPGWPILLADGSRDLISIRSIFADVPLRNLGFDFALTGLPAACFEIAPDNHYHRLNADRLPKIGALLAACGDLRHAYHGALSLLAAYPVPPGGAVTTSLTKFVKDAKGLGPLAVGLAILLQQVVWREFLFREWARMIDHCPWDANKDCFDPSGERTLRVWLDILLKASVPQDGGITKEDAAEVMYNGLDLGETSFESFGRKGVNRCLDLLVESDLLKFDSLTQTYLAIPSWRPDSPIWLPDSLPEGFVEHAGLSDGFISDGFLRDEAGIAMVIFGHEKNDKAGRGDDNHVALPRKIKAALSLRDDEEATRFLKDFRDGIAPVWLKEVCRQFVRERNWSTAIWPEILQD